VGFHTNLKRQQCIMERIVAFVYEYYKYKTLSKVAENKAIQ